jgi:predicted Zn-dependent protease with MMP-like domain
MRSVLRPTLGALAVIASVVGVVVLLLNPPSLSGAEDLLAIVAVAVALVLVSAWGTVALIGRDEMSEPEFERVVLRSERLAERREPAVAVADGDGRDGSDFDAVVADAIDRLPEEFQRLLEDTPVVVSHRGRQERAYGHYYGDTVARDNFEDRIILYRDTLERDFGHDPELLEAQIERTLRHELAHHLGWGERGVRDLGL